MYRIVISFFNQRHLKSALVTSSSPAAVKRDWPLEIRLCLQNKSFLLAFLKHDSISLSLVDADGQLSAPVNAVTVCGNVWVIHTVKPLNDHKESSTDSVFFIFWRECVSITAEPGLHTLCVCARVCVWKRFRHSLAWNMHARKSKKII